MIENIRRYTGLIFVVIVLLLLGFIFMDASTFLRGSAGGGGTFVTINGRAYSQKDYTNLGRAPLALASGLRGMDEKSFEIMRFVQALAAIDDAPADATQAELEDLQNRRFFINRMLLRDARDEFGVHPSDAEVAEFIEGLSVFGSRPAPGSMPGQAGEFDQAAYNQFVRNTIGRFGLSEADLQELIRDVIAASTIRAIVGEGLGGSRRLAEAMAVVNQQTLDLIVSPIDKTPFIEAVDPTEEDLKGYWETVRDAYKTERRIKVSYLLLAPETPAEPEPEEPAGTEDDGAEAPAEDEDAPEPEPSGEDEAGAEEELAERKAAAEKDLAIAVDNFLMGVEDSEGEDFETLVKEQGWELVETDWFTRADVPAPLRVEPRGTSTGRSVTDRLFDLETGPDPLARFSKAVAVGENQWLVARLDESEEVRTKTFEEAREEVREDYIEEKATAALEEFVERKMAGLREGLGTGEEFAAAAKALDLKVKDLRPYKISESLENEFHARAIFQAAATTNPGELAEPLYQPERAVIIYVEDRTIVKDDNRGQQVDRFLSTLAVRHETAAFDAWVNQQFTNARLEGPAVR